MEAVVRFSGWKRGPTRTHFHYLTLHGTRPLNICSRCSATNNEFRLSISWFSVFLKVTFVCNGVSGNGNACAQAARREPKKCTRFAIGLIQQLPHLSNLLLWVHVRKRRGEEIFSHSFWFLCEGKSWARASFVLPLGARWTLLFSSFPKLKWGAERGGWDEDVKTPIIMIIMTSCPDAFHVDPYMYFVTSIVYMEKKRLNTGNTHNASEQLCVFLLMGSF